MEVKICNPTIKVNNIRDRAILASRDNTSDLQTTTTEAATSRMIEEDIEVEINQERAAVAIEATDIEVATIIKVTIFSMVEAVEEEICIVKDLEITRRVVEILGIKEEVTIEVAEAAEAASAEAEEIDRITTEIN